MCVLGLLALDFEKVGSYNRGQSASVTWDKLLPIVTFALASQYFVTPIVTLASTRPYQQEIC